MLEIVHGFDAGGHADDVVIGMQPVVHDHQEITVVVHDEKRLPAPELIVRVRQLREVVGDVVHVQRAYIDMRRPLRAAHLLDLRAGRVVHDQAHGFVLVAAKVGQIVHDDFRLRTGIIEVAKENIGVVPVLIDCVDVRRNRDDAEARLGQPVFHRLRYDMLLLPDVDHRPRTTARDGRRKRDTPKGVSASFPG